MIKVNVVREHGQIYGFHYLWDFELDGDKHAGKTASLSEVRRQVISTICRLTEVEMKYIPSGTIEWHEDGTTTWNSTQAMLNNPVLRVKWLPAVDVGNHAK